MMRFRRLELQVHIYVKILFIFLGVCCRRYFIICQVFRNKKVREMMVRFASAIQLNLARFKR